MARTTAIELGPDSCLLAGVRPSPGMSDVFAVHAIDPAHWPEQDDRLMAALRAARRQKGLPRRATVVDWGLSESASASNPVVRPGLRPIRDAGFRIAEILSPPAALARLAATHARRLQPGANAWLALNTHGAAIAIVRRNAVLFSRVFNWSFMPRTGGSASQVLQRYSLVAHLAPELERGLAQVRATGVQVNAIITCGNLPDLRSFTMPLIQELDLEVETLDSSDGLRPTGRAKAEPFAELAPALRLACAAVARPPARTTAGAGYERAAALAPVAAACLVAAGLAWVGYASWTRRHTQPVPTPAPHVEASRPAPTPGPGPAVPAPPRQPGQQGGGLRADKPAAQPEHGRVETFPAMPEVPAVEPLPRVDSILIDQDRRLALIQGAIVEPGQRVGSRTVVRIGPDFVLLREPSGRTVRVALRQGVVREQ